MLLLLWLLFILRLLLLTAGWWLGSLLVLSSLSESESSLFEFEEEDSLVLSTPTSSSWGGGCEGICVCCICCICCCGIVVDLTRSTWFCCWELEGGGALLLDLGKSWASSRPINGILGSVCCVLLAFQLDRNKNMNFSTFIVKLGHSKSYKDCRYLQWCWMRTPMWVVAGQVGDSWIIIRRSLVRRVLVSNKIYHISPHPSGDFSLWAMPSRLVFYLSDRRWHIAGANRWWSCHIGSSLFHLNVVL